MITFFFAPGAEEEYFCPGDCGIARGSGSSQQQKKEEEEVRTGWPRKKREKKNTF